MSFIFSVAQRDTTKNTCLLVIFIGRYWKDGVFLADEDDSILSCKDIWSNFTGNKCPFFKNKAKVFIFQVSH